jgi:hypothetical protein
MNNFMRKVTVGYEEALKEVRVNRTARTLERKSSKKSSLKAYGTTREVREPENKRYRSTGGF